METHDQPAALPAPIEQHAQAITIYQIAVAAMALAPLVAIAGGIWLAAVDRTLPDYVVALASLLAGGLVTLVAKNS